MLRLANVVKAAVMSMAVMLAGDVFAEPEDAKILDKQDVPEKVLAAFNEAYPGVDVTAIEKEEIKNQVYYEFEIKIGKSEKDIVYLDDGSLYAVEEEISINDLPEIVIEALKKAYPGGEIDELEKVTRGTNIEYEAAVEVEESGKEIEYEIAITSKGEIIGTEQINDEDVEEDNNEDGDVDDNDDKEDDD